MIRNVYQYTPNLTALKTNLSESGIRQASIHQVSPGRAADRPGWSSAASLDLPMSQRGHRHTGLHQTSVLPTHWVPK